LVGAALKVVEKLRAQAQHPLAIHLARLLVAFVTKIVSRFSGRANLIFPKRAPTRLFHRLWLDSIRFNTNTLCVLLGNTVAACTTGIRF
jgi:hypothetical protein